MEDLIYNNFGDNFPYPHIPGYEPHINFNGEHEYVETATQKRIPVDEMLKKEKLKTMREERLEAIEAAILELAGEIFHD